MKKHMIKLSGVALLLSSLSGCVIYVGDDHHDGESLSSVFGSVDVAAGRTVGDVDSVNGGIELGDDTRAEALDSVNGTIDLGRNVTIHRAEVVNGDIKAGENLQVVDNLETVNGDIRLKKGSEVGGRIETINGDISLNDSIVRKSVSTVNGDMTFDGNTHIFANVVYEKDRNKGWNSQNSVPVLTIGPDVIIDGDIVLYRNVELRIDNADIASKVQRRYGGE